MIRNNDIVKSFWACQGGEEGETPMYKLNRGRGVRYAVKGTQQGYLSDSVLS